MLPLDLDVVVVVEPVDEGVIPSTDWVVVAASLRWSLLCTLRASVDTHRLKLVAAVTSCPSPPRDRLSLLLITRGSSATWRRILTIRPRLMRPSFPAVGSTSAIKVPICLDIISLLNCSLGKSGGVGELEGVILYMRPWWGPVTPAAPRCCSVDTSPPPACSLFLRLRFG